MSRMASFPFLPHAKAVRWGLCILIACLAMHFLVEDSLLLHTAASPESAQANPLSYDQVTHQDDLVLPVHLPERIMNNAVPAAYFWIVPVEMQTESPILTPPKIA